MLGFEDEVWWSRLAQPDLHSWSATDERLQLVEKAVAQDDPDPKALAGYGLLVRATPTTPEQIWLRFATGQPVSDLTTQLLGWCSDRLAAQGKHALLLAEALDASFTGRQPLHKALADYEQRRNAAVMPLYELTAQFARLALPPEMQQLLGALLGNQAETNRFLGMINGTVSVQEFFSPESIGRIMQTAAMLERMTA